MRLRYLFASLCFVMASCDREPIPEHSIFLKVLELSSQADKELFVAPNVDNRWFLENRLPDVVKDGEVSRGGEPAWLKPAYLPLLERLYQINSKGESLGWAPEVQKIKLLEGTFAARPEGAEIDAMCLSTEPADAIGVARYSKRNHRFRPYYSFSRVAFDDSGTLAMVKYGLACAPLSGANESLLVFRRVDGRWVLEGVRKLWVS